MLLEACKIYSISKFAKLESFIIRLGNLWDVMGDILGCSLLVLPELSIDSIGVWRARR